MFKKVLIGFLLAAAFGILAFGAVNRTYAKAVGSEPLSASEDFTAHNGGGNGNSHGTNNEKLDGESDDCIADGEALGYGVGDGSGYTEPPADGTGNQYGISSNGSNAGSRLGTGLEDHMSDMDEWFSIQGVVDSASYNEWIIILEDETSVELYARIVSYLADQGFSVESGDELLLMGFYDIDGEFEIGQIEKVATGETVLLRDEFGRPLWSGSTRGGGPRN